MTQRRENKELKKKKIFLFFLNFIVIYINSDSLELSQNSYRTVLHSISSYQTQTTPNYFYNKTRARGVESNYRTIIKNLELFLKTGVFLKKKQ